MRFPTALGRAFAALLSTAACLSRPAPPPMAPVARVVAGPWLIDPKAGSMTVAWLTDVPAVGRVWYGTAASDKLATEQGPPAVTHRVGLTSLPAQTQLRYRIDGGDQDFVFTSPPDAVADAPLRILVYGDNRTNSGDHALIARAAAGERAALALHTGDMVVNATDDDLWRTWFLEERELLATTPIIPTVGNHEITDDGVAYSKYFQRKGLPAYWSVDYGPVHIAVLDSFETAAGATPHSAGVSDAQRAWFEEDLRTVPPGKHVWVLVHQGPYSHPAKPRLGHGGSDAVRAAVNAGRAVHPIEAVFAGHEHFYERGEIDGLRYFVLGGGGAPLDDPDPSFPGVQIAQKALSYATVEVCGCHARGKVKDLSGAVIDSFELATCAAPCGVPTAAATVPAVAPTPALVLAPLTEAADGGVSDGGRHRRERRHRRRSRADAGVSE